MYIDTEKKEVNLNKSAIVKNISSWIEQDIIVPDSMPDAIKIISITVNSYVNDCEVMEDKLRVSGKLNYYILYKCDDTQMRTRGLHVSFPYTQILNVKGANRSMYAQVCAYTKNVIYSLPNERKMATKTEVVFKVKLKMPVNVPFITKFESDDEIETKTKSEVFSNIINKTKSVIVSKEEIMLSKENEDFFEILKVDATIKDYEYKESYNKIMVKGIINLDILYLSENSDEIIKKINTTIPFTGMVEVDGISDKSKFDIEYILQDLSVRPNSDITNVKTITVEYQVEVDVTMFEKVEVEYISDFYSQRNDLSFNEESIDVVIDEEKYVRDIEIKETLNNVLDMDTNLVEYTIDSSYVIPRVMGNTVHLEGSVKLSYITVNTMSKEVENKTVDLLVNQEYEVPELKTEAKANVSISIANSNVVQNSNDIDVRVTLKSIVEVENISHVSVVDEIINKELDSSNLDSMNIYIVRPKDTLWSIAKQYKTSVEKIIKTNEIFDKDKIDVGQKILIIR